MLCWQPFETSNVSGQRTGNVQSLWSYWGKKSHTAHVAVMESLLGSWHNSGIKERPEQAVVSCWGSELMAASLLNTACLGSWPRNLWHSTLWPVLMCEHSTLIKISTYNLHSVFLISQTQVILDVCHLVGKLVYPHQRPVLSQYTARHTDPLQHHRPTEPERETRPPT